MQPLPEFLNHIGIKTGYLIAGFFGGIAHVLYIGEKSIVKSIALVCSGVFATVYITPIVVEKFSLSEQSGYAAAFIVGILGMYIVGGVIKMGQLFKDDPFGMLKSVLNLKSRDN